MIAEAKDDVLEQIKLPGRPDLVYVRKETYAVMSIVSKIGMV
jgi:hypothetical protein